MVSVFLRFYRITDRGLMYHDEAHYLLSSRFYVQIGTWVWQNGQALAVGTKTLADLKEHVLELERVGGTMLQYGRPLHYLLIAITSFFVGFTDWTSLVLSATLGVLTIALVFLVGTRFYDRSTGLLAAAILAVSPYHICYSRAGLSQLISAFLALLGIYLYYLSQRPGHHGSRFLVLSGLVVGFAFTSHYNLFWEPAVLVGYELLTLKTHGIRKIVSRLGLLSVAMLLPLLLFQVPFQIVSWVIRRSDVVVTMGFKTYFEQIYTGFTWKGYGEHLFDPTNPLFYVQLFWTLEGPIIFSLLALGLVMLGRSVLRHRSLVDIIMLSQFLVPILIWSVFVMKLPRSCVVALPAMALIAARGSSSLVAKVAKGEKANKLITLLLLAIVMLSGTYHALPWVYGRTGYRDASIQLRDYLQRNPGAVISSQELGLFSAPIWWFYLGNLVDRSAASGDILIVDLGTLSDPHAGKHLGEKAVEIEGKCLPVIVVPNEMKTLLPEEALPRIQSRWEPDPGANLIRIFDRRRCK